MNTTIKKRIEEINSGRVPEGYEKTSFGIFPCDWEEKEIKDIAYLGKKKYDPSKNEINPICVELEHIISQRGMLNGHTYAKNQNSLKNVFCKGDILFGKLRSYLAKYYHADFEGVCSTEIWVIKSKENINNDFLYQLVKDKKFINDSQDSAFGTKMPRAEWAKVEKSKCYLPTSQKEQSRIAEILMQWDKAIELQEKYIKQLELRKKALMQRLLTPKEGWTCKPLGYYFYKEKGKNVAISVEGKKPIIDMDYAINNRAINFSNDLSGVFALDNEIIILWDGASAGKVLYGIKGIVGSTFCVLRQVNKINSKYVYFYLDYAYEKNKKTREGSGIPHMPKDFLKKQAICSPENILEQNKIANILTQSDNEISLQTQKLDKLIKQRKALQQYLLTGIVRV